MLVLVIDAGDHFMFFGFPVNCVFILCKREETQLVPHQQRVPNTSGQRDFQPHLLAGTSLTDVHGTLKKCEKAAETK